MGYKVPEAQRLTEKNARQWLYLSKEIIRLTTEAFNQEDGYFWIPRVNAKGQAFDKSAKFLCRATFAEGWRIVAVNIPAENRSATWEELHWVKKFFWEEDDIVLMFHPGKSTYVGDHSLWLHLWQPERVEEKLDGFPVPPIFEKQFPFRKVNFVTRLFRIVRERIKIWKVNSELKRGIKKS